MTKILEVRKRLVPYGLGPEEYTKRAVAACKLPGLTDGDFDLLSHYPRARMFSSDGSIGRHWYLCSLRIVDEWMEQSETVIEARAEIITMAISLEQTLENEREWLVGVLSYWFDARREGRKIADYKQEFMDPSWSKQELNRWVWDYLAPWRNIKDALFFLKRIDLRETDDANWRNWLAIHSSLP